MDYTFFNKIGKSIKEIALKAQSSHFIINNHNNKIKEINGVITDTRFNIQYSGIEWFSSIIESKEIVNEHTGFGRSLPKFTHGMNSGYSAIQFAILAGYKEIYLIGFDMSIRRGETHFHDSYKNTNIHRFGKNIEDYKNILIKALNKTNDVKIKTLTSSKVPENILPSIHIDEVLREKAQGTTKPKINDLMIVAYYTLNTAYEAEANKLKASLSRLGLEFDIVGVKNLGNWQANTRFKAKFMQDMLNKHKDKNLLYVDVDAVVHSQPILFNNYDCDIAVRWQDFRWRKNECLSGTIYMANNSATRELCKRWERNNVNEGPNAKTFEQWNLGKVIKNMEKEGKIKAKNLPPEYTFIFDSMKQIYPNTKPIIEHFQASRKYKNKIK